MLGDDTLHRQLSHTLVQTDFPVGTLRRGKVRDVYDLGDRLLLVASDRLSAFDVNLTTIPFKGQILTELASWWFEKTADVCPNHVIAQPDPSAILCRKCEALPVEVVVRGYITGSLWRDYESGKAGAYGIAFPKGLKRDQAFPQPIITPTTKAEIGQHDEAISSADVVAKGLVDAKLWEEVQRKALALFARGQELARKQGLILVDTKYEFGLAAGQLLVIDEIHTPDSSRYWEAAEYDERFSRGAEQKMLDKENLRQWLIQARGWQGQGTPPEIPAEVRVDLARKYIAAYERITGTRFTGGEGDVGARLEVNLRRAGLLG